MGSATTTTRANNRSRAEGHSGAKESSPRQRWHDCVLPRSKPKSEADRGPDVFGTPLGDCLGQLRRQQHVRLPTTPTHTPHRGLTSGRHTTAHRKHPPQREGGLRASHAPQVFISGAGLAQPAEQRFGQAFCVRISAHLGEGQPAV